MSAKNHLKKITRKSGFTLVEMLVVVATSGVLIAAILGIYLAIFSNNSLYSNKEKALTEMRTVLDSVGKETTFGTAYNDGGVCTNTDPPCTTLGFMTKPRPDMPERYISYYLDTMNGVIMRGEQTPSGICNTITSGLLASACYQRATSENVRIDSLKFFVNNKTVDSKPIITVSIGGVAQPGSNLEAPFEVSSSFSPRLIQDPNAKPTKDNQNPEIKIDAPSSLDWNKSLDSTATPPETPFETSALSISLSGLAKDNVDIKQIEWENRATRYGTGTWSGKICSIEPCTTGNSDFNWITPPINLAPGIVNRIIIKAWDSTGNYRLLRYDIKSTLPKDPPKSPRLLSPPSTNIIPQECGKYMTRTSLYYPGGPDVYYSTSMAAFSCLGETCIPDDSDRTKAIYYKDYNMTNQLDNNWIYPPTFTDNGTSLDPGGFAALVPNIGDSIKVKYCAVGYDTVYLAGNTGNKSACGNSKIATITNPPPLCNTTTPNSFAVTSSDPILQIALTSVNTPGNDTTNVKINPNNFSSPVTLSLINGTDAVPSGTVALFNPNSINSANYNSDTNFVTLTIPGNTPLGTYNLKILGTGGGKTSELTIYLVVSSACGGEGGQPGLCN